MQCAEKPFLLPSEDPVTTLVNIAFHKVQCIWGLISRASSHSLFITFSNKQIKITGTVLSKTSMLSSDPFFTIFNLAAHKYTLHFNLKLHL